MIASLSILGAFCFSAPAFAQSRTDAPVPAPDTKVIVKEKVVVKSNFAWGVDVGTSIDASGYDMSTIDARVMMGYKNEAIRIIGLGVGISRAFGNNSTFIPFFLTVRTSFRKKPSPCFLDFRAGYSLNTIRQSKSYGDISGSIGLGINLATGRNFSSHIIMAYSLRHITRQHQEYMDFHADNIHLAQLSFGINF